MSISSITSKYFNSESVKKVSESISNRASYIKSKLQSVDTAEFTKKLTSKESGLGKVIGFVREKISSLNLGEKIKKLNLKEHFTKAADGIKTFFKNILSKPVK